MASTILIVAKKSSPFFEQFEAALLKRSYPLLTVRNPTTVLERLQSEPFAAIVVDIESIPEPESLINQLYHHPMGSVTPVVLLEPPTSPKRKRDLFSGRKTILDQAFRANDITPDSLADYLLETVHAAREGPKRGDLSRTPTPILLQSAHNILFTGGFTFEKEGERRLIYFVNGNIVFASSSNPSDYFGELLVNRNLLTREQLKEALSHAKLRNLRLGHALVELKFLRADLLFPLLEEQMKHIIHQLFNWERGTYTLLVGDKVGSDDGIFKIPVGHCIHQGIKLSYNENRLLKYFRSMEQVIMMQPSFADHLSGLPLETKERELIRLLQKPQSLKSITQLSPLSFEETLHLCLTLLVMQICRLKPIEEAITPTTAKLTLANPMVFERNGNTPPKPITPLPIAVADLRYGSSVGNLLSKTDPEITVGGAKIEKSPNHWANGYFSGLFTALLITASLLFFNKQAHLTRPPREVSATIADPVRTPTANPTVKPVTLTVAAAPPAEPVKAKLVKPVVPNSQEVSQETYGKLFEQGMQFYKAGNLDQAFSMLNKAMQFKPNEEALLVTLSNIAYDLGRDREAMSLVLRALKINPQNAGAHLILGGIYLTKNQIADARNEYQQFLAYSKDTTRIEEVKKILSQLNAGE